MDEQDITVFDRLQAALDEAAAEEKAFEAEVTSDSPSSQALYGAFERWTEELFGSARGLQLSSEAQRLFRDELQAAAEDGDDIQEVADYLYVRPLLELHLARFVVSRLRTAPKRLKQLLKYLTTGELRPRAASYFQSVAQLYLLGFNAEAVVMARSALEAVLESRLEDHPQRVGTGQSRENLAQRIKAAGPSGIGLLDEATFEDAEQLREAGNDAVHLQLGAQDMMALDAIKALYRILLRLDIASESSSA